MTILERDTPAPPPSGKAQLDARVPPGLRPGNNSVDVTVTKTASQDAMEKLIAEIQQMLARCDEEMGMVLVNEFRLERWLSWAQTGAK